MLTDKCALGTSESTEPNLKNPSVAAHFAELEATVFSLFVLLLMSPHSAWETRKCIGFVGRA